MGYTTYLFGAGASAKAIPTYFNQKNDFTQKFIEYIYEFIGSNLENIITNVEYYKLIVQIREECPKHYTIDTYARKLYLSNSKINKIKLKLLKLLLSNFLEFCQMPKTNQNKFDVVDIRYDVLLSSILEKSKLNPILQDDIRFISWNYDNQLEMALLNFNDANWKIDKIMEKYQYYPRNFTKQTENLEQKIVKLNGLAGKYLLENSKKNKILNLDNEVGEVNIKNRLRIGFATLNTTEYLINFAWENKTNNISQQAIKYAKEILKNTDKLIVIGYSFPGYNHDVDLDLFKSLKYTAKILYQSRDKNSEHEISKIKALLQGNQKRDAKVEHTNYCGNFVLPYQFDQYF